MSLWNLPADPLSCQEGSGLCSSLGAGAGGRGSGVGGTLGGAGRGEALTMMPVRRQTPFPQYVWGTMSP